LDINTANLEGCNAGGYNRAPNIIIINIKVIMRFYGDNDVVLKASIIETIIHELYHADQIINYNLYNADINYTEFIERSCELQTCIYMAGHAQEIYDVFNVDSRLKREDYNKCIMYWSSGSNYQRRRYIDHLFMCIDNIVGINRHTVKLVYNHINDALIRGSDIYLTINDDIIPIQENLNRMPMEEFNARILQYSRGYVEVRGFSLSIGQDKALFIDIQADSKSIMCKNK
jgi:hypothetical protein